MIGDAQRYMSQDLRELENYLDGTFKPNAGAIEACLRTLRRFMEKPNVAESLASTAEHEVAFAAKLNDAFARADAELVKLGAKQPDSAAASAAKPAAKPSGPGEAEKHMSQELGELEGELQAGRKSGIERCARSLRRFMEKPAVAASLASTAENEVAFATKVKEALARADAVLLGTEAPSPTPATGGAASHTAPAAAPRSTTQPAQQQSSASFDENEFRNALNAMSQDKRKLEEALEESRPSKFALKEYAGNLERAIQRRLAVLEAEGNFLRDVRQLIAKASESEKEAEYLDARKKVDDWVYHIMSGIEHESTTFPPQCVYDGDTVEACGETERMLRENRATLTSHPKGPAFIEDVERAIREGRKHADAIDAAKREDYGTLAKPPMKTEYTLAEKQALAKEFRERQRGVKHTFSPMQDDARAPNAATLDVCEAALAFMDLYIEETGLGVSSLVKQGLQKR